MQSTRKIFWQFISIFALIDIFLIHDSKFFAENILGYRFFINYIVSLIIVGCSLFCARVFFHRFANIFRILFVFFIFVAVLQLNYFATYREFISPMGFGFAAKNKELTLKYFFENIVWIKTCISIIAGRWCYKLAIKYITEQRIPPRFSMRQRWLGVGASVVAIALFCISILSWFFVPEFQNNLVAFANSYVESLSQKSRSYAVKRPQMPVLNHSDSSKTPSIVLVIGESATLSHFQLFGYKRNTTPHLVALEQDKKLVALKNAVSVGHRTMLSVPYMLFGLEGPDSKGRIYKYPSLFNYAKARGMQTSLISAQDLRWYNIDKLIVDSSIDVYKSGTNFTPNVTVSIGADDMLVLNKGVKPFLEQTKNPYFLVIQMNGSHYPYTDHSPEKFKKFLPEGKPNSVNAYDNTIVYLDYYLDELLKVIRKKSPNAWVFYSTDHGQNVGEDKKFNSGFDLEVTHNPLIVFPPDSSYRQILSQQNAPVSQIDIAKTILDLIDVEPIMPIDGFTLLNPIPPDRIRITSAFMPTFSNEPTGVVFFPNLESWKIDFAKQVVIKPDDSLAKFEELPEKVRRVLKH